MVQYYGSHLYGSKLWIVMDYAQGGSIRTLMKAASSTGKCRIEEERLIAIIARESLIALSYLHKNGIIHRDIKGEGRQAGRVQDLLELSLCQLQTSSSPRPVASCFVILASQQRSLSLR